MSAIALLEPAGTRTDGFGPRGYVPGVGDLGFHNGQDFASPLGSHILASADGVVSRVWWDTWPDGSPGGGNMVEIYHGWYRTRYAHMQMPSPKYVGERVSMGDVIGYVGSTGASNGAHLHHELLDGNFNYLDPVPYYIKEIPATSTTTKRKRKHKMILIHCIDKSITGNGPAKFAVFTLGQKGSWWEFTGQTSANQLATQIGGVSMNVAAGTWNERKKTHS